MVMVITLYQFLLSLCLNSITNTFSILSILIIKVLLALSLFLRSKIFLIEVFLVLVLLLGSVGVLLVDGRGAVRALQLLDEFSVILFPRRRKCFNCKKIAERKMVHKVLETVYIHAHNVYMRTMYTRAQCIHAHNVYTRTMYTGTQVYNACA